MPVSGFQKDTRYGHDGSFIREEETQVSLDRLVLGQVGYRSHSNVFSCQDLVLLFPSPITPLLEGNKLTIQSRAF